MERLAEAEELVIYQTYKELPATCEPQSLGFDKALTYLATRSPRSLKIGHQSPGAATLLRQTVQTAWSDLGKAR